MHAFSDPLTARIAGFLREIGLEVLAATLPADTFLPGIALEGGRILVDESRLAHPGDLLHEAGHLAVKPAAERAGAGAGLDADLGEEMGAIAWSYAAVRALELDPAVVFHSAGYRGAAHGFLDNFAAGRYVAVPLLQWMELCMDEAHAAEAGVPPYPHMLRWLRE